MIRNHGDEFAWPTRPLWDRMSSRQRLTHWLRLRCGLVVVALLALVPFSVAAAYVVSPGDTLSGIADRYGLTVESLAMSNGIANPDLLLAGQSLEIPGGSGGSTAVTYAIQDGDNLSGIADRFGLTMQALADANGIDDTNSIYIGQVLQVPLQTTGRTPTAVSGKAALRSAEVEFGLPHGLLLALAWQESGWNQAMVSNADAIGLTQLLPSTGDWAVEVFLPDATDWRVSARDNARLGAAIMRDYIGRGWGVPLALAAYYQGWHSIELHGVYDETQAYVANVLALVPQFQ
jgi:N-acetylmuramoyl-L-alanine amidase